MLKWLLIVFTGLVWILPAQEALIKGQVLDSLDNPLVFATVVIKNLNSDKNTFRSTDENGKFELRISKKDSFLLKVFFLGFEPYEKKYEFEKDGLLKITLVPSTTKLDEVTLNFERPIVEKKDTISYKVNFFNLGDERKLKDVLANLPGIEVANNGDVFYKGLKVNKLLVDNNSFFNGATKLGVENIPSDAIDHIDILENYNEIAFLKGLSKSENIALNVGLKEDKKNFIFGDLEASEGNSAFKSATANTFFYGSKLNVNFISKFNNTGEEVLSMLDYLSFTSKVNKIFEEDFTSSVQDYQMLYSQEDFIRKNQKFTAVNYTKTAPSKWSLSTYFIVNGLDSQTKLVRESVYTSFEELFSQEAFSKHFFMIGELKIGWQLNKNWRLLSLTNLSKNIVEEQREQYSETNFQDMIHMYNTNEASIPKDLSQRFELHSNLSPRQIFSVLATYEHHENVFDNFWRSNSGGFSSLLPIIAQPSIHINQLKDRKTETFKMITKHFWKFNNHQHLYTTIRQENRSDFFSSKESQQLIEGQTFNFDIQNFGNNTQLVFRGTSIKLIYKFMKGKFTASQGFSLENFAWQTTQSSFVANKKWFLLPQASFDFEIDKTKKVSLDYILRPSFANATSFANNFYLSTYNSVFRGNEALENELQHQLTFNFNMSKLYKGETFYMFFRYAKKEMGFVNTVQFQNQNQFLTRVLLEDSEESLSINGHFQKKLKHLKLSWMANARTSNYLQLINDVSQLNSSTSVYSQITAETRFKNYPNVKAGANTQWSEFTVNAKNSFVTYNYFGALNYTALKNYKIHLDYNLMSFKNRNTVQENTFESLNFSTTYVFPKSPWSVSLSAHNLLDVREKRAGNLNTIIVSDIRTFTMPRLILFRLGYKL